MPNDGTWHPNSFLTFPWQKKIGIFFSGQNDDHPAAMTRWLILIIIVKYLYFAHKRVTAPPSVMTVLKWMVADSIAGGLFIGIVDESIRRSHFTM